MITKRPSHERGHGNHGWLDTRHTFSFAGYYDPSDLSLSTGNGAAVSDEAELRLHAEVESHVLVFDLA